MGQKQKLRLLLVVGLILVSLGGWLLHLRIHPPLKLAANIIPFLAEIISFTVLPILFLIRSAVAYAHVINGMLVIIGTITMAHYSMAKPPETLTPVTVFLSTLFPDIVILFTSFVLGKALFELTLLKNDETPARRGRFFRYPNMGWWLVHLVAMSVVYALGHFFWK